MRRGSVIPLPCVSTKKPPFGGSLFGCGRRSLVPFSSPPLADKTYTNEQYEEYCNHILS